MFMNSTTLSHKMWTDNNFNKKRNRKSKMFIVKMIINMTTTHLHCTTESDNEYM